MEPDSMIELAKQNGLVTYFYGKKSAEVKHKEEGKEPITAPFFMDSIIVLEGQPESKLKDFVISENFNALIKNTTSNYAAIFTRIK